MNKKYVLVIALAIVSVFAFSFTNPAQAQVQATVSAACPVGYICNTTTCPSGYICSPMTNLPSCPSGYTCTPFQSDPNCPVGYICTAAVSTETNPGGISLSEFASGGVGATIIGTPKLALTYDSNRKESALTATFDVSVYGGTRGINIGYGGNVAFINSLNTKNTIYPGGTITPKSPVQMVRDENGQPLYAVTAGSKVSFQIVSTAKPSQMFAGRYYANLSQLNGIVGTSNLNSSSASPIPLNANKTNLVTIVGEVSPYITAVTNPAYAGRPFQIKGERLGGVSVYIDNIQVTNQTMTSPTNGTMIGFNLPQPMTLGGHMLYVINSRTGQSNNMMFEVTGGGSQTDIPVTLKDETTYGVEGIAFLRLSITGYPTNTQIDHWTLTYTCNAGVVIDTGGQVGQKLMCDGINVGKSSTTFYRSNMADSTQDYLMLTANAENKTQTIGQIIFSLDAQDASGRSLGKYDTKTITIKPKGTVSDCLGYIFSTNLTVGSTGPDVAALQSYLISRGYNIPDIASGSTARGYFGATTKAAVMRYQSVNGINESGYVGPLTRAKLNSCGTIPTTPVPDDPIVVSSPSAGVTLRYGVPTAISWTGNWSGSDVFDVTEFTQNNGKGFISSNISQTQAGCPGFGKGVCGISWTPSVVDRVQVAVSNKGGTGNIGYSGWFNVATTSVVSRPSITSINPTVGGLNTTVTISGSGFTSTDTVEFDQNGRAMGGINGPSLSSVTSNQIVFTLGSLTTSSMQSGVYQLKVTRNYGSNTGSNSFNFTLAGSCTYNCGIPATTSQPIAVCPVGYICTTIGSPRPTCPIGYSCSSITTNCPSGYQCMNIVPVVTAPLVLTASAAPGYEKYGTVTVNGNDIKVVAKDLIDVPGVKINWPLSIRGGAPCKFGGSLGIIPGRIGGQFEFDPSTTYPYLIFNNIEVPGIYTLNLTCGSQTSNTLNITLSQGPVSYDNLIGASSQTASIWDAVKKAVQEYNSRSSQ